MTEPKRITYIYGTPAYHQAFGRYSQAPSKAPGGTNAAPKHLASATAQAPAQASLGKPPAKQLAKKAGLLNASELLATVWPSAASRPSERWLRERSQQGDLPSVKIGGLVFYNAKEVQASLGGTPPQVTEKQLVQMTNAQLWEALGKIQGEVEQREFYCKHLRHRPGLR